MSPYDSDGVDVTMIQWMLSLTPEERLQTLQDFVDFIWATASEDVRQQILRDHSQAR